MNASCGPRLVVISGVTSGIGRALALTFAQRDGFIVAGGGRLSEELATLKAEAANAGRTLSTAVVDVADDGAVAEWARQLADEYDRLAPTLVIANAGVSGKGHRAGVAAHQVPRAAFDAVMAINIGGVVSMASHFLPSMLAASAVGGERRAFIGISSGSGRSTGATKAAYSASKFAVEAYVKCLAHSLKDTPVAAVPLAPGTLQTGLNPSADRPTAAAWSDAGADFLIDRVLGAPHADVNGASLSVPGFYEAAYLKSWIIQDGQPLMPESR